MSLGVVVVCDTCGAICGERLEVEFADLPTMIQHLQDPEGQVTRALRGLNETQHCEDCLEDD